MIGLVEVALTDAAESAMVDAHKALIRPDCKVLYESSKQAHATRVSATIRTDVARKQTLAIRFEIARGVALTCVIGILSVGEKALWVQGEWFKIQSLRFMSLGSMTCV